MDDNSLLTKTLTLFDHSYETVTSLYDRLTYSRNIGICEYRPKVIFSGNVIKYNNYKMGKTQVIQMPDEEFEIPDYRLHPEKYINQKDSDGKKAEDGKSKDGESEDSSPGNDPFEMDKSGNNPSESKGTGNISASTKHLNQKTDTVPENPSSEPKEPETYDDDENYVVPPLSDLDDF